MATIQTKLTSDNRQHDEAFSKSKQQVYNYNKQVDKSKASVLKFAKGGLGALSAAFGVAGGAMAAFQKTMRATQKTSDAFDNVMAQSKASVDYFFTSLSRGDFSGFINGLKEVVQQAKETQIAIDNLQTATMLNSNAGAKYGAERSRLERIIRDPKSTTEEIKKAQDELAKLPEKYAKALDDERREAELTFRKVSEGIFTKYGLKAKDVRVFEQLVESISSYNKMVEQYPSLGLITDEDLQTMGQYYKQYQNLNREVDQLYIQNSKLLKVGNTSSSKTISTPIDENNKWDEKEYLKNIEWNVNHYYTKLRERLNEEKITFTPILYPVLEERPDASLENILNTTTEMEYWSAKEFEDAERRKQEAAERTAQIFSLQIEAISSLGSAFSSLGNAFESDELNIAGIITQAIANIIKGYSTASAQAATAGPMAWAAFSVAGLAEIASVISQIHSLSGYAEGGIIGGNSYTGDRVLARVNSGEMILNHAQQARLFDMINMGSVGGGEVEFKIKGQELVGVLNNYNRKVGRVR